MQIMNDESPNIHDVSIKDEGSCKSKCSWKHANKHTTIIICFLLQHIIISVHIKQPVTGAWFATCCKQCPPHLSDNSFMWWLNVLSSCTVKYNIMLDLLGNTENKPGVASNFITGDKNKILAKHLSFLQQLTMEFLNTTFSNLSQCTAVMVLQVADRRFRYTVYSYNKIWWPLVLWKRCLHLRVL